MLARGLRLKVHCNAWCVVGARAALSAPTARRAHVRRLLDRAHGHRARKGTVVLHLHPSRHQAKRLRRLKKVTLTVRVGVRSRGGPGDSAAIRMTLPR